MQNTFKNVSLVAHTFGPVVVFFLYSVNTCKRRMSYKQTSIGFHFECDKPIYPQVVQSAYRHYYSVYIFV